MSYSPKPVPRENSEPRVDSVATLEPVSCGVYESRPRINRLHHRPSASSLRICNSQFVEPAHVMTVGSCSPRTSADASFPAKGIAQSSPLENPVDAHRARPRKTNPLPPGNTKNHCPRPIHVSRTSHTPQNCVFAANHHCECIYE